MADKNKIGKKYTFTWLVEKGKIREFAEAIGDDNPIYKDAEVARKQGYKDIVAMPTFAFASVIWTGTFHRVVNDLDIDFARIMHAEQEYEYYQEIFPGDELQGVIEVKQITEKKGKSGNLEFVQFETIYTNQHNELILMEEMLIVVR